MRESIDSLAVSAYQVPTDGPESDGTLCWDSTTLVLVEVRAGDRLGQGFTYADQCVANLIPAKLRDLIVGRDAMDVGGTFELLVRALRNLGRSGLTAMAVAAVDIALWDLKAHLLELPLVKLLGQVRTSIPAYGSGGFTSYSIARLQQQLGDWTASGLRSVKMKIGREPGQDVNRVRSAREAIGDGPELYVDANGAYSLKQALEKAEAFRPFRVSWFEEPVPSDDLTGLRFIRERAPAEIVIAAGEYGYDPVYFRRMLETGAVDVLQADATRCGGISGFLQAGALCEAFQTPLSAHTAPSIHQHPCCAVSRASNVEYFYDHYRIEQMFFEGAASPVNGELKPDLSRAGLGLEFKRADARKYQVC
jgi:L-alanine-DL-glutamate epimerase-like enolase superfamily enzyme